MDFEWDELKQLENIRKHGVSFAQAIESFSDPAGIKLVDLEHSDEELRLYWVGKDSTGEILTTRFTQRGSNVRIFGCGKWRKYRRYYNEAKKS